MSSTLKIFLISGIIVLLGLFILLGFFVKSRNIVSVVIALIVLSLVYGILCLMQRKVHGPFPRTIFIVLLVAGTAIRFFYFDLKPDILSDDVYRYLWDGKVQANGINPYLYSPDSNQFDPELKNTFYDKINHREYKTIYPPLSELLFFIVYIIGGNSFIILRFLYLFFDLICGFIIYTMCKKKHHVFIYFLCPLLIVETYIGMHIDIIGAAFLVFSLYFFKKQNYPVSFVLLACSVLIKYVTFGIFVIYVFSLFYSDQHTTGKNLISLIISGILFFLIIILFYIPYLIHAGFLVFDQLFFYNQYWEFNSIIHPVIRFFMKDTTFIIKIVLYSFILFGFALYKKLSIDDKIRGALLVLLLLNGALFPWYLIVLLPFLVLEFHYADLFLFFVIQISYVVLIRYKGEGIWEDCLIIRLVEYIPFFLVLIYEQVKGHYVQKKKDCSNNSGIE